MQSSRRDFIKITIGAGACLSLGLQLSACSEPPIDSSFSPNAWLSIYPNGKVVIMLSKAEMGQGVITAIPRIIADELELDWSEVSVKLADADPQLGSMRTSGSRSIRDLWQPLRKASASAREMLIAAAAAKWNISTENCLAEMGKVLNTLNGASFTYSELCIDASSLPVPDSPTLKQSQDFNLIGQKVPRINIHDLVTGTAKYGIDTTQDNLHYAAVRHAPLLGAKLGHVSLSGKRPAGVKGIIELKSAVAVVANSYWLAVKTLNQLELVWQSSSLENLNQHKIEQDFKSALKEPGTLIKQYGTLAKSTTNTNRISYDYRCAYQGHLCMEPINCTVHVHENGCDVWAPTQHPIMALGAARTAYHSQLSKWSSKVLRKIGISDNVIVHPTLIGGGFGRRLEQDFVTEAVIIAKHFDFPIKILWSREEDIKNDFYRPYSAHRLTASLDQNKITHWKHLAVGASEGKVSGGAIGFPYNIPNRALYFNKLDHGVPIGSWRSVSYSNHVFATESFIDEIAIKEIKDPLAFRLSMLQKDSRAHTLLKRLAELSNWYIKKAKGHSLGVAFNQGFGSYIAMVAEILTTPNGQTIHEIFCVADCGIIIDPDNIKAQIEGGIIFGINAAIGHSIHIEKGGIKESNFDNYPLLRMNEIPTFNIQLIKNNEDPGGVGEIAVPIVAPALANAAYSNSGTRHRKIPFSLHET